MYDNVIKSCFSWNLALVKTCEILSQSICRNLNWSVLCNLHGDVSYASNYVEKFY